MSGFIASYLIEKSECERGGFITATTHSCTEDPLQAIAWGLRFGLAKSKSLKHLEGFYQTPFLEMRGSWYRHLPQRVFCFIAEDGHISISLGDEDEIVWEGLLLDFVNLQAIAAYRRSL